MKRSIVLLAALSATLASCVTAPDVYDFPKSRVIPESKDVVWGRVVEFFASNSLSIKTIEKDSGLVVAERMFSAPSRGSSVGAWASCGSEPLAVPVRQSADLNVFVRPQGSGVSVTVNTRFTEVRQLGGYESLTLECNSNGSLEAMVLDAAAGR